MFTISQCHVEDFVYISLLNLQHNEMGIIIPHFIDKELEGE